MLLFSILLCGMAGCGKEKNPVLSGSYTSVDILNQMNYTFDEQKNVTVRFLVGGYVVSSQNGTYDVNPEGTIITFTFPTETGEAGEYLPGGMSTLGGVFSFRQETDCVWIGAVRFQKDAAGTGAAA